MEEEKNELLKRLWSLIEPPKQNSIIGLFQVHAELGFTGEEKPRSRWYDISPPRICIVGSGWGSADFIELPEHLKPLLDEMLNSGKLVIEIQEKGLFPKSGRKIVPASEALVSPSL